MRAFAVLEIAYASGVLLIAYQNNGKGVNQDYGFARDESNITEAAIFAELKPQAKTTLPELLDLFASYLLTLGVYKNKETEAFVKACKDVKGSVFYVLYENHFYELRKLPSRTNKVPIRKNKFCQFDNMQVTGVGAVIEPTARVGAFCIKALYNHPGVKLRVKIIGEPYRSSWRGKSKVHYLDPINPKEAADEPIGS